MGSYLFSLFEPNVCDDQSDVASSPASKVCVFLDEETILIALVIIPASWTHSVTSGRQQRLHLIFVSYHRDHSMACRLSPTWLVYLYPAFSLLFLFNLFITALTEEHRHCQDQTHQMGNFDSSFYFPYFSSHKHIQPSEERAASMLSPVRSVHCFHMAVTPSALAMSVVSVLTSKHFNNKATKCFYCRVPQYSSWGLFSCQPAVFCHFYSLHFYNLMLLSLACVENEKESAKCSQTIINCSYKGIFISNCMEKHVILF